MLPLRDGSHLLLSRHNLEGAQSEVFLDTSHVRRHFLYLDVEKNPLCMALVDTLYNPERIDYRMRRVVFQRPPLESGDDEVPSSRKQMN